MLLDRYRDKIKSVDAIQLLVGSRPRSHKVIMCHGVFDLVHPGHIRHLLYSKSKATILVASLTSDRFIDKGIYRPHVPEDLRALNLAALEMVDYVIIDDSASPIANIERLQPDFYSKGFEYHPDRRGRRGDISEVEAVESYGGEVLYTPGDVVYSSTKLLKDSEPNLRAEKLWLLMEQAGITFESLHDTLNHFGPLTVLVVGDSIVDSYTHCSMIGGQTKTPTISALFERREDFVGGAAVVAKHLKAAGAGVKFATVVGGDIMAKLVLDDLARAGVQVEPVIEDRPTTNKNAIVIGGYRMLKVDTLDNRSISDYSLEQLLSTIIGSLYDGLVYSDFHHGMFNARTMPELLGAADRRRQGTRTYTVADSQVASRWGNIADFRGFDLITPNEREARFATGDQDSGIRPLASKLYKSASCKLLMMKMGARGVLTVEGDSFFSVDSFADQVIDPVGAGDAYLAYATLSMLARRDSLQATILGTMAAAIECGFDGNVPVTVDQVRQKLNKVQEELG